METTEMILSIFGLFIAAIPAYFAYRLFTSAVDHKPIHMK